MQRFGENKESIGGNKNYVWKCENFWIDTFGLFWRSNERFRMRDKTVYGDCWVKE